MSKTQNFSLLAMLAMAALVPLSGGAKNVKVYVRSNDNVALAVEAWNSYHQTAAASGTADGVWTNDHIYGETDALVSGVQTETIGGNTWYWHSFDTDQLKAQDDTYDQSYFNIQFLLQDKTWYSGGWGIRVEGDNITNLPDELFFTLDHNATTSTDDTWTAAGSRKSWVGVHETTREQAEGKEVIYFLMNANNKRVAQFEPVRNQNQGLHSMSTSSFAATIWAKDFFGSGATTTKFYVKAFERKEVAAGNQVNVQYDELPKYQYRPWNNDYDITPNPSADDAANREWQSYGNCRSENSNPNNTTLFTVTKKELTLPDGTTAMPQSYTILLNTSNIFSTFNDGQEGNMSISSDKALLVNYSPTNKRNVGVRGIGIHPNKPLATLVASDETMYVISNMQPTYHEYWENAKVDPDDDSWDLTDDRPMSRLSAADLAAVIKASPTVGEAGDVVYSAEVKKPGNSIKSIFMGFVTGTDRGTLYNLSLNSSATDEEKTAAWDKVIRPFVAEGKDALSMFGGLYRPVNVGNGAQALSPGTDDDFYTKCMVYINLTKGTYAVVPTGSYDLTGPAIRYFDPTKKEWRESSGTSEEYWGNGESSFWTTPMAYNAEEGCWEYTGQFYQSIGYDESKEENDQNAFKGFYGFRFLTNHLYTINYREDYDRPAATQSTDLSPVWASNDGTQTGHEDSYYYNHVDIDPDINPSYDGDRASAAMIKDKSANPDRERTHNINFSLPGGMYTIKFYPEGTTDDPHPFYILAPAENAGTEIPESEDDDITKTYKYLRTFSSTTARKLSTDLKCFIVTGYNQDDNTAQLTSIPYIPANTGVILAYTMTEKEKLSGGNRAKEIADGIYDLEPYLVVERMSATDSATYAQNETLQATIKTNKLKPTTFSNGDGTITNGGFKVNTSDFKDGNTRVIAYRNYNFSFLRKKAADGATPNKYKLGFWRIKTGNVSPNRAYLQLTGEESGGTTPTPGFDNGMKSSVMTSNIGAKQVYNRFVIDYPDWGGNVATAVAPIQTVGHEPSGAADAYYYTLQGIRLVRPNGPGLYIHKGRKMIVR